MTKKARSFDVVIVSAGAAGVGMGGTLRHSGIEDFVILDRATVGASFFHWPIQMRFIPLPHRCTGWGPFELRRL